MREKKLLVTVGLPRSGKSTLVNEHIEKDPYNTYQLICADDIRLGLGTKFDRRLENFVWGIHDTMLLAHMQRGYDVIIDACNTTDASLKKYQGYADKEGYELIVLFKDTPLKICLERNHGPEAVPEPVLMRMSEQLERLQKGDWWADNHESIIRVTEKS